MFKIFDMCFVKSIVLTDIYDAFIPEIFFTGGVMLFQSLKNIFSFSDVNNTFIICIIFAKKKIYAASDKIFSITASLYFNTRNFVCFTIPI